MADKKEYKVVGTRPIRHDGVDKVTGRALYGADFRRLACYTAKCCAARTAMRGLNQLIPAERKPIPA